MNVSHAKRQSKKEIEWTEEITGKKAINNWKMELSKLLKELVFTMTPSSSHNAEVMVANVSKASGIEQMLERFDLSGCETLAIGDSDKDLKMFEFVSHSVAMKNAPDHVKAVVDEYGIYL